MLELSELLNIIKVVKRFKPNLILAIGGGAVLDYAKLARGLANQENLIKSIKNSDCKIKKISELVAIPTTAGSGAEVTSNAVIYIKKIKYSVEHPNLIPDYYFLIPELIIKAPLNVKSSAGFDAIAQAIESLISKKSNLKSVNYAKKSLEISLNNYLNFINSPNKSNSTAMSLAANLSGQAINISRTTAPHAISYPFTAHFGINHGHAVSLTLNKFLRFNYQNLIYADCKFDLKKRFQIIFDISKTYNIENLDKFLENLKNKAKLEQKFSKLGINLKKYKSKILSEVNVSRLSNNPVNIDQNDLLEIIK